MALISTKPLKAYPPAAAGASVTPSSTAWANSAWVQLVASTGAAILCVYVVVEAGVAAEFEIDIGKGGAGSETVVGIVRGCAQDTNNIQTAYRLLIPIDNIASGSRVAARIRKAGTSTTAWAVALAYEEAPDTTHKTANPQLCVPSAAAGVSITPSGTTWVNSSYVELTSGIGNVILISGIAYDNAADVSFELDIATGAAASEVVITTLRGHSLSQSGHSYLFLPNPLEVAASTRVAIRLRKSGTSTTAWLAAMSYYRGTTTYERVAVVAALASVETAAQFYSILGRSVALDATASISSSAQFLSILERVSDFSGTADVSVSGESFTVFERTASLDASASVEVASAFYSIFERQIGIDAAGSIQAGAEFFSVFERSTSVDALILISIAGQSEQARFVSLGATGSILVSGEVLAPAIERSVSLTAVGAISVSGQGLLERSAAFNATATVSVSGQFFSITERAAAVDATASTQVSGHVVVDRSASLAATGTVSIAGTFFSVLTCAVEVDAVGLVQAAGFTFRDRSVAIGATATISVSGVIQIIAAHERAVVLGAMVDVSVAGWLVAVINHPTNIKLSNSGQSGVVITINGASSVLVNRATGSGETRATVNG